MDKTMTLSFKTNPRQTNIRHNNRELTEKEFKSDAHKHIQREKSKYNIQIVKRDIKDVYHELFDDALNAYNAKQKRKDRKIDDYYKHVQKSKNLDLQREFIVTVGNKADWERLSFEEKQEVGEALERYVRDFNERHDNMTIYNAIVHLDESGAPHAHFNVIPTARLDIKMDLQSSRPLERLWSKKDLGHLVRSNSKRFEMQKFIVYINLYMKLALIAKLVKRTISKICANTRMPWNTSRTKSQVRS